MSDSFTLEIPDDLSRLDEPVGDDDTPAPLLADRVTDIPGLFVHGRMLGNLRRTMLKLVKHQADDPAAAETARTLYDQLRSDVLATLHPAFAASAESSLPVLPQDATLGQLVLIADQSASFIDALSDVDGFVVSQQIASVNIRHARQRASEEHRRLESSDDRPMPADSQQPAVGHYL